MAQQHAPPPAPLSVYAISNMTTGRLWCSGGTNGSGGAIMRLAMVDNSLGAAAARAMTPVMTSGVAGRINNPPNIRSTSCSAKWKRVATPKFPPPPRIAQNRSGSFSLSTRRKPAVCGNHICGEKVVDRQPVSPYQVPDTTPQCQPADPDRAGVAETGGEAVARLQRSCIRRRSRPVPAHAVPLSTSISIERSAERSSTIPSSTTP